MKLCMQGRAREVIMGLGSTRISYSMRESFSCVEGISGKVILDMQGDREPDYWITDMAPNGTFIKIAEVLNFDVDRRVS